MVYEPDPEVRWPDPTLGIFAKSDEKFLLPGNVGGSSMTIDVEQSDIDTDYDDILTLDQDHSKFSLKLTSRLVFHVHSKICSWGYLHFFPYFFFTLPHLTDIGGRGFFW